MNFKLANLSTINQKYGKTIEQIEGRNLGKYMPIVADAQEIAVPTGCSHKTNERVKSQTIYLQGYQ